MSDPFKQVLAIPQVARWKHQGIECAVHQHPYFGTRNGYVLIPDGHPLYQLDESDAFGLDSRLEVHGGVTFGPERSEGGHVVGFDTNHVGDYSAGFPLGRRWTLDDVVEETNRLAGQVAQWGRGGGWVVI